MAQTEVDRYLEEPRSEGGRITSGRRAIVVAFLDSGGHVTAEELAARVQVQQPDVALSTVYRTMETLEDRGVVEHLHLGHGPAVYHRVGEGHHHLVCDRCGRIVELPDATFDKFAAAVQGEFGFQLEAHHFALPGLCDRCTD